jgi:hypothetical protein
MLVCTAIAPARNQNLYPDGKPALQSGSFAKMIHRIIFIRSALPCFAHYGSGGIIFIANLHSTPPFGSAPQTPFIAGPLAIMGILQTREIIIRKIVYL